MNEYTIQNSPNSLTSIQVFIDGKPIVVLKPGELVRPHEMVRTK